MQNSAANWRATLAVYRDVRMAKILLLGFISGFPWLLIASMVSVWLKDEGVSRTGIGLFGLVFFVYAINALWAPLVDGVRLPFLGARFGRRRSWIIAMQLVIILATGLLASLPAADGYLWWLALFALLLAAASATQDVAIDALRIEIIGEDEAQKVGAGAAMATSGWWLGFGGGKAIVFPLVMFLQDAGVERAWQAGYAAMTVVVAASVLLLIVFVDEKPAAKKNTGGALMRRAAAMYVQPVLGFLRRYSPRIGIMLLMFVFFFKIGEAFLGKMSLVFYKEIGISTTAIGLLSGGLGAITVSVFAILGGFINARYGLLRGIIVGGIAMASTNLLFAALAYYPSNWLFAFTVVADQFTTGVSTVAFVAFLSQLCHRAHTATHYAALASLGNLSRTTLAAASGYLVDGLGGNWPLFFVITVLMVLPSLAILFFARRDIAPIMQGATTKLL